MQILILHRIADSPEHSEEVVARGGGVALMKAIRHLLGNDDPLIDALLSVGRLADQSQDASFALVDDAHKDVTQVLKTHVRSPDVMAAAANSISALSQDPEFARVFGSTDGLVKIFEGLRRYPKHVEFCTCALSALENLAEQAENVVPIHGCDGDTTMLETIKLHPEEEPIQAYGIRGLALCAEVSDPVCMKLGENGSIRVVLDALRRFPDSPAVVLAVAQVYYFFKTTWSNLYTHTTRSWAPPHTQNPNF